MDEKKRPGGAEKARSKKRKALEEDAAKCAKITDLFSRAKTQVATGKERYYISIIDLMISISNVIIRLIISLSTYLLFVICVCSKMPS